MFGDYKLVLGYAPTRRDRFPDPKDARANKVLIDKRIKEIISKIGNVELVDIDWLNEEGLLVETEDVAKVARHFKNAGVDAIFMPHTNFGQELVVAELGKAMNKPFLLWGPRDLAPPAGYAIRQTDVQCGLFASGKALLRYGVNFTYIENCWLDSPILEKGLDDFIRVATVVKKFKNMRLGRICLRTRQFTSVMFNESELLEKFGIEIIPINSPEFVTTIKGILKNKKDEVAEMVRDINCKVDTSTVDSNIVENIAALELGLLQLAKQYNLDAISAECAVFDKDFGIFPCFAWGDLTERGLPVACEADVLGSVSSLLLTAAARGETPNFLADVTIRHPENDNGELLWHCGPFPSCLAKEGCKPALIGCAGRFEIKGGDVTIIRFDSIGGKYMLFAGEAKGIDGPTTSGNYLWIETDNWVKWEKKLVKGPYIHHVAAIHGNYIHILDEAVNYLGNIERDFV